MKGAPIDALRKGTQLLFDLVKSDNEIRSKVKLSIITFASDAQQTPLTPIADFKAPLLQAEGVTRLDGALHVLADSIEQDVRLNTTTARGDYPPLVFLFLGSNPTDAQGHPSALYQAELPRLRALSYNYRPTVVAIACGPGADMSALKEITPEVLHAHDLSSSRLLSYFKFTSGPTRMSDR